MQLLPLAWLSFAWLEHATVPPRVGRATQPRICDSAPEASSLPGGSRLPRGVSALDSSATAMCDASRAADVDPASDSYAVRRARALTAAPAAAAPARAMPVVACEGAGDGGRARPARGVPWQARLIGLQQYMLALLLVGYASFLTGERLALGAVQLPLAPPQLSQQVPAAVPPLDQPAASERALAARQMGAAARAAPELFWQASDRSLAGSGEPAARQAEQAEP